jgi:hypothetical protein
VIDMARERRSEPEAVRITSAAAARSEDIARRQKKYLISMSLRSVCFVGAIAAALLHIGWLWPILIAGALILPYVAVVMANASTMRTEGVDLVDHGTARRQLGPGHEQR